MCWHTWWTAHIFVLASKIPHNHSIKSYKSSQEYFKKSKINNLLINVIMVGWKLLQYQNESDLFIVIITGRLHTILVLAGTSTANTLMPLLLQQFLLCSLFTWTVTFWLDCNKKKCYWSLHWSAFFTEIREYLVYCMYSIYVEKAATAKQSDRLINKTLYSLNK